MDDTLVRYSLGLLPDDEAQRLDESSIADDDFAARLAATEHDLIDAYVAGDLPEEYRGRVEAVFGTSIAGRAQIRFAAALASRTPVARAGHATLYRVLAAAAVVLLALGASMLFRQAPVRQGTSVAPAQSQVTPPPAETPPAAAPSPRPAILAFVLAAPTRSAADAPAIAVPASTYAVELRLEIEGDDFPAYDATLKDASGLRALWRSGRLEADGPAARRVVPIRVPGNLLTPRRHILELRGLPARGAAQTVGSYAFRVVLE